MNHLHPRDRAVHMLESCRQLIAEVQALNANPNLAPIDCEEERVAAAKAQRFIAAWDRCDEAETVRLAAELNEYTRRFR